MSLMKTWAAAADRLKQAIQALIGGEKRASSPRDFGRILAHWQIDRFTVQRRLPGSSAAAWLIETPRGSYVLRRAGEDRQYIEFQAFVMNALAEQGFRCHVPRLLDADGCPWHAYQGHYWVVYPFISGNSLGLTLSVGQTRQLGALVAQFHELSATWDIQRFRGRFSLALFEAQTSQAFSRSLSMTTASAPRRLLAEYHEPIRRAFAAILDDEVARLAQLDRIAIHYDWQGFNLLGDGERLSAVLDFDSLVEAPRLVDFLNALFYSGTTDSGVDRSRLRAFVDSYVAVSPLSPAERELAYPLALDRLLWLIVSILAEQERRGDLTIKDDLLMRLVQALLWLLQVKKGDCGFNRSAQHWH